MLQPLAGVVVMDFSRVLAGPMATQILAELGADVLKVEQPGTGDESRTFEPKLPHGESAYYLAFNRGKRSVTLNLKTPRGQELARQLASRADVLVENFLPGAMGRLGLGYEALAAANERLIYISSTGFGQAGPYSQRRGYDTVFQALSGIMSLTGHRDSPPAKAGVPISDMTSALWIVIAALAGLAGRARDGRGMFIDLAMMDAQLSLLAVAAARVFALNEDPDRSGTEHPGRVPSAAFACADGRWLHISVSDQHWQPLCRVLGLHDLAGDSSLDRNEARVLARERINQHVRAAVAVRNCAELAGALREQGVPVGEVNTVREALEDANTVARGMVGHFNHPVEGEFPALRLPLCLAGERPAAARPPLLGEHTDVVLSQALGLHADDIASLRAAGVI